MPVGHEEVSAQAEEYLEAICRIQDRGELATPTELAHELEIAPPSVLGMLKRLEEQGLLNYARHAGAVLTERGQRCADTLRRRHRLAERLLTDLLGMPWERAHHIACRFEHVIDSEVEDYLQQALHYPATCPHGNPLSLPTDAQWRALSTLHTGQSAQLRCIKDETPLTLDYLNRIGLRPGVQLTVCDLAPFDGPLTIKVGEERQALSRDMANCLLVEVEGTDA